MDYRMLQAFNHYNGIWPYNQFPDGTMFWQGLRITVMDFVMITKIQERGVLID